MAAIDKVKVIVVGDSGVGKSSITHLISQNEPISNPSWTVGCSVEVKLHEYKEGTPLQKTYFIELWDVGGSSSHRNTRCVFYNPVHGIILVHDLTNRKSQQNLQKWLSEVLNRDTAKSYQSSFDDFDPEQFVGSTQVSSRLEEERAVLIVKDVSSVRYVMRWIPILVIGTKLDLAVEVRNYPQKRSSTIAEECGADEIFLDCHQVRSLAAGSSSAVKLSRFFDKVIELRYPANPNSPFGMDKRRSYPMSPLSPKFHHSD